jgi:glycerol-3-phosphate acyltransferase PlsY
MSLPIAIFFYAGPGDPLFALSVFMMLLVIWTHRTNISRLRRGEEPRVGRGAEVSAQ